ncbi:MAG: hypothetical protein ACR65U_03820, partial [Methylocystis sp.]
SITRLLRFRLTGAEEAPSAAEVQARSATDAGGAPFVRAAKSSPNTAAMTMVKHSTLAAACIYAFKIVSFFVKTL